METLEQLKARIETAAPGAQVEIVPNGSPANQPSLLLDGGHARAVALDSIDGEVSMGLLARYRAADVAVRVWDVTSDVFLPCFVALVVAPDGPRLESSHGG